jgi:hypothetical protein
MIKDTKQPIEKAAASNLEDYELLADELRYIADILNQYASELDPEATSGNIANIAQYVQVTNAAPGYLIYACTDA